MRIYIDMDNTICDYIKKANQIKEALPSVKWPQSLPKFFLDMEPTISAIETVNWLRKHHDVFILSAPSSRNPNSYTEKFLWIDRYAPILFHDNETLGMDAPKPKTHASFAT